MKSPEVSPPPNSERPLAFNSGLITRILKNEWRQVFLCVVSKGHLHGGIAHEPLSVWK